MEKLHHARQRIEKRMDCIDEITFFATNAKDGWLKMPDLSQLIKFDLFNANHVACYLENPSNYVRILDSENWESLEGILLPDQGETQEEKVFSQKIKLDEVQESGIKRLENGEFRNIRSLVKEQVALNSQSAFVIVQFLESSKEESLVYDYFKYWVVKKKERLT